MNFLSHYYFDRHTDNPYEVFGAILPDLMKNANKGWNLHPEKARNLDLNFSGEHILKGWKRHLQVDRIFHNTAFFFFHQHELKLKMLGALKDTPVKPFFLGHIGTELILDHLLLKYQKIDVSIFYGQLSAITDEDIRSFLQANGLNDSQRFFEYFNNFRAEKYLSNYIQPERISYALRRICARIWPDPFGQKKEDELTEVIEDYIKFLETDFMLIFEEIEAALSS